MLFHYFVSHIICSYSEFRSVFFLNCVIAVTVSLVLCFDLVKPRAEHAPSRHVHLVLHISNQFAAYGAFHYHDNRLISFFHYDGCIDDRVQRRIIDEHIIEFLPQLCYHRLEKRASQKLHRIRRLRTCEYVIQVLYIRSRYDGFESLVFLVRYCDSLGTSSVTPRWPVWTLFLLSGSSPVTVIDSMRVSTGLSMLIL